MRSPSGDQVDGLPMVAHTDAGCVKPRCGSKLNGAARVDFGDVLRIVTSDYFLHLREHSSDTQATFPPSGV